MDDKNHNRLNNLGTNEEQFPFVIKHRALKTWNCLSWTLDDWAHNCQDETKFKFRVHKRTNKILKDHYDIQTVDNQEINWENKAIDYIEATMSQLVDHVRGQQNKDKTKNNPFKDYPLENFCLYSAYNHMDHVLDSLTKELLNQAIQWSETGLFEKNEHFESTIWIGTTGSYTPCHQDTYGYNFVGQLYGKKLWILFPPSDTVNLYPTRIPYEESSIFSQVDLNLIDLRKYPRFAQARPYIVELNPGDLLYVPYHWWHYVENIQDSNMSNNISISVNTWIDKTMNNSRDNLNECLVQLLFNSLFQSLNLDDNLKWLNINVNLLTTEELIQMLIYLINNSGNENYMYKKPIDIEVEYIKESKFNDLLDIKPLSMKFELESIQDVQSRTITSKDIINSILHPDVIDLIVKKLKQNF